MKTARSICASVSRERSSAGRIQSNSPGKIWKNLIILGSAAGEAFIAPPGDIRAYDVVTGQKMWQFHTIPLPGEFGYDTWPKEAYKYVGGANNWGSMSVDEERGILYVPTGSANYDFYGADRVGQNLFANCLLALDAKTGKRLWHFQTVHHDLWDFDNVAAPQLVTVRHNGRKVDAVALAGKTNFLYVFDRVTGKPLWPIEERPVPKSEMPGEKAWPTQPWPTKPAPFGRMTFTVDDVSPWLATPEQYEAMKERVAKARNEGPFTPPGLTDTISMPGNQGGANWGTTASNPEKGLVFVVGVNQVAILKLEDVRNRTLPEGRGGGGGGGGQGGAPLQAGFLAYQQVPAPRATGRTCAGRCRASPIWSASPIASVRTPSRRRSPAARATCGPCRASPTPRWLQSFPTWRCRVHRVAVGAVAADGAEGRRSSCRPVQSSRAAGRHSRRHHRASWARSIPESVAMPATCRIPQM